MGRVVYVIHQGKLYGFIRIITRRDYKVKKGLKGFIVGSIVVCILTLSVYVSAESKDISIFINNKLIKAIDAQVIIQNERIFVPLRFIAENLGAEVSWNADTYSVNINSTNKDIQILKLYSRISDRYRTLDTLGSNINRLADGYSLAYNGFTRFNDTKQLYTMIERTNQMIDMRNSESERVGSLIEEAKAVGIDISDMNDILSKYYHSLEFYEKALRGLTDYSILRDDDSFNDYLDNTQKGFEYSIDGQNMSYNGYTLYYVKLQLYY